MILGAIRTPCSPPVLWCFAPWSSHCPSKQKSQKEITRRLNMAKPAHAVITSWPWWPTWWWCQHFADCNREILANNPNILVLKHGSRLWSYGRCADSDERQPARCFQPQPRDSQCSYRKARPGANYKWSLDLLRKIKEQHLWHPNEIWCNDGSWWNERSRDRSSIERYLSLNMA